jgi:hypothetical protein
MKKQNKSAGENKTRRKQSKRRYYQDTFVKPGEPLRFAEKLKKDGLWPKKRGKQSSPTHGDRKRPVVTPFLYVPAMPGDMGVFRPLPNHQELFSQGIQLIDTSSGMPVLQVKKGGTYRLRCEVINRGSTGAYAGLCNFYIVPKTAIDAAVLGGTTLPIFALTGFMLMPNSAKAVDCPKLWSPITDDEAQYSVLAQVFDPFGDNIVQRYNAQVDRHVGRRDHIPDFSGIWDGMESANQIHLVPTRIRISITQNFLQVNVSIFGEMGGGIIPSTPQDVGSGHIDLSGTINSVVTTEYWGPSNTPFAQSTWILSLPTPDILHFEHYKHYLMPGDTRPDTHTNGDLHRI